jgi:tRNA(Ile)-lysidine synthase
MLDPGIALRQRPALVAVSGGSDSVALFHWMIANLPDAELHCVTVDHGLRPEAADEACVVAEMVTTLGYAHETLKWRPVARATSADARAARYNLLHEHAKKIDAGVIVLGHTRDDQAETVFMRALRSRADSDTRGLSGMCEWSTLRGIRLWRPLLKHTRQQLRDHLSGKSITWIDDPSNADASYERVRTRALLNDNTDPTFPSIDALSRLATLSGKTRLWINQQVANCIRQSVQMSMSGKFVFTPTRKLPRTILLETLSCLVLIAGGQPFRSPNAKLADIADAMLEQRKATITQGRCLITTQAGSTKVQRENRNLPEFPRHVSDEYLHDGRLLLRNADTGDGIEQTPYIEALEMFRPSLDDRLHTAVMDLLDSPSRST